MVREYYALATGKEGATFGLDYDAYGILIYNNETSAKKSLRNYVGKISLKEN